MKKICALVLLLGSLAVAPGCGENCGRDSKPYFDVTGMGIGNILSNNGISNTYSDLPDFSVVNSVYCCFQFGIQLIAQTQNYSLSTISAGVGTAFACSPLMGDKGSREDISEILISSDAQFDPAHPAGSNLNEFFKVSAFNNHTPPKDSISNVAIPLSELLQNGSKARQFWQLWLTQFPETALSHRFTVVYRQTNGEEYVVTTPPITFQ